MYLSLLHNLWSDASYFGFGLFGGFFLQVHFDNKEDHVTIKSENIGDSATSIWLQWSSSKSIPVAVQSSVSTFIIG